MNTFLEVFGLTKAIDTLNPSQDEGEDHEAIYRSLLTLLHAVVNVCNLYRQAAFI